MQITLVVATDLDGVIGRDNSLPWHLPADLRHFKAVTMGKPMILGRKTWESIGGALPGRTSIVLTRQRDWQAPGALVAHTPEAALALAAAEAGPAGEVMVIGGEAVFGAFLPLASRIHWTQVQAHVGGDTRIEPFDPGVWRETARRLHVADAKNPYALVFRVLERGPASLDTQARHL
jgi:dihydrofolate reductase